MPGPEVRRCASTEDRNKLQTREHDTVPSAQCNERQVVLFAMTMWRARLRQGYKANFTGIDFGTDSERPKRSEAKDKDIIRG